MGQKIVKKRLNRLGCSGRKDEEEHIANEIRQFDVARKAIG